MGSGFELGGRLVFASGSPLYMPFLWAHLSEACLDQARIAMQFALALLGYRGG